jgi:hypothetical protein
MNAVDKMYASMFSPEALGKYLPDWPEKQRSRLPGLALGSSLLGTSGLLLAKRNKVFSKAITRAARKHGVKLGLQPADFVPHNTGLKYADGTPVIYELEKFMPWLNPFSRVSTGGRMGVNRVEDLKGFKGVTFMPSGDINRTYEGMGPVLGRTSPDTVFGSTAKHVEALNFPGIPKGGLMDRKKVNKILKSRWRKSDEKVRQELQDYFRELTGSDNKYLFKYSDGPLSRQGQGVFHVDKDTPLQTMINNIYADKASPILMQNKEDLIMNTRGRKMFGGLLEGDLGFLRAGKKAVKGHPIQAAKDLSQRFKTVWNETDYPLEYRVTTLDGKVIPYSTYRKNALNLNSPEGIGIGSTHLTNPFRSRRAKAIEKQTQEWLDQMDPEFHKGILGLDVGMNRNGKFVAFETNPSRADDIWQSSSSISKPQVLDATAAAIKGRLPAAQIGIRSIPGLAGAGILANTYKD